MAGALKAAKEDAGLNFGKTALKGPPRIMETTASSGLTSGLKRIGGRRGVTRLGRETRKNLGEARRGRPVISHKY